MKLSYLRDADGIWLRVIDDGSGFDPSNPGNELWAQGGRSAPGSAGWSGSRLTSERGRGTSVEILLA